ncbi:MAG: YqgE/AlgH family protein [Chitinivibrionales bacterium]|nr:YqgE/AlgH family protein [Chitinivibrionales bacterium]
MEPSLGEYFDDIAKQRLKRLKSGCILLSEERLRDPNFESSIVLICAHNDDGAFGFVVNRPSHMPLCEVFSVDVPLRDCKRKIYIGGPVRQEELQLLQITDNPRQHSLEIAPRVFLGGEWSTLEEILDTDENATRLFLGYSGWGAGQLEGEILQGAWEVFNVDLYKLFTNPEQNLIGNVETLRNYLSEVSSA